MLDNEPTGGPEAGNTPTDPTADSEPRTTRRTRARSTRATAGAAEPAGTAEGAEPRGAEPKGIEPKGVETEGPETEGAEAGAPTRRRRRRATTEASAAPDQGVPAAEAAEERPAARRSRRRTGPAGAGEPAATTAEATDPAGESATDPAGQRRSLPPTVLFMAPETPVEQPSRPARGGSAAPAVAPAGAGEAEEAHEEPGEPGRSRRSRRRRGTGAAEPAPVAEAVEEPVESADDDEEEDEDDESGPGGRRRRRRGRRGRGRGKGTAGDELDSDEEEPEAVEEPSDEGEAEGGEPLTRRRRRRRRGGSGGDAGESSEDGVLTVVRVRPPRAPRDEVQGVSGSTRLEAKRQRRRDGRDQRRTRPPILSESEFLARREAVDRTMVVREKGDRTQIAVLEDGVLVEHYVTRASSGSMVGNVYLGKVQNVLPSMEAAFIDIGRGRNGVLYAGEVNWDAAGLEGRARSIEQALKSGDSVLVQVTKDPIGHKGARLTSHLALSGRHLVYVPGGNTSGISRKLADTERKRLRDVLKHLVPESAGVIVRTAAEGAAEDELERDVTRLQAQWEEIERKAGQGGAPVLLYEEPDLVIRVVRDLFNEDFRELVVQGGGAYDMVEGYLRHVSPDLLDRLKRHTGNTDVFAARRIDEQILKGLDRKVYLPSGGSLVIDRTEAMTVIDVNTGKYTGTGGNLEETVTRNNLEAAEEIVRQLRLRDLGGIVVIDFIDMVLESNRELVLRRLTECLGRDRTKHQVTEITSLGLVQMTRKRIGQGLLEAFSETCEHCKGRGVIIHTDPVPERKPAAKAAAEVASASNNAGRRRNRDAVAAVAAAGAGTADELAPDLAEDADELVAGDLVDDAGEPELGEPELVEDAAEDAGDEVAALVDDAEDADDADDGGFAGPPYRGGGAEGYPANGGEPAAPRRRTLWSSRRRGR